MEVTTWYDSERYFLEVAIEFNSKLTTDYENAPINWSDLSNTYSEKITQVSKGEPIEHLNQPIDILNAWTVLEVLSPQVYKNPKDFLLNASSSIVYLEKYRKLWLEETFCKENENIFYFLFVGSIDMTKASRNLLKTYGSSHIEDISQKGFNPLAVIILDQQGKPVSDKCVTLSSFAWGYGRALQKKLHELKAWNLADLLLKERLQKIIYRYDKQGRLLALTSENMNEIFYWLVNQYEIPIEDVNEPSFLVKKIIAKKKGVPSSPILNSFFLDDLERAKYLVFSGKAGEALSQYLAITAPSSYYDLLKDKQCVQKMLQPKYMPWARWPGKGRYPLVLYQQLAVNITKQQLHKAGIFSINGPPGTGKTTLLRDIIANVILDRAKALSKFEQASDAFEYVDKVSVGQSFLSLYKLNETLQGHEIIVTSSNNKAVENISKELPLKENIADEFNALNYFNVISDALFHGSSNKPSKLKKTKNIDLSWGLISAKLGNSENRSEFDSLVWWGKEGNGLYTYFKYILGQLKLEANDNGELIYPKIISKKNTPKNQLEAEKLWKEQRVEFNAALERAEKAVRESQHAYELYEEILTIKNNIQKNDIEKNKCNKHLAKMQQEADALHNKVADTNELISKHNGMLNELKKSRPNFFISLFIRSKYRDWRHCCKSIKNKIKNYKNDIHNCVIKRVKIESSIAEKMKDLIKIQDIDNRYQTQLDLHIKKFNHVATFCDKKLVCSDFWDKEHAEQQIFSPVFLTKGHYLRDDLFVSAIKLHKAFIDASAKALRQNLGLFFFCLKGNNLPNNLRGYLSQLWASICLVIPVISTTFASVGTMLRDLPPQGLGWLLIDEAGQASPQAAVGAISRAKRVVAVGDPLQIEPVVSLSVKLVEAIANHMSVNTGEWMAPQASVQTLADRANAYGTSILRDMNEIRIGAPLLVHRRCEEPMFSMSNQLAYSGLMVYATSNKSSTVTDIFSTKAAWFDVQGSGDDKWCQGEGQVVIDLILRCCRSLGTSPNLYVISPFKLVAQKMRELVEQEIKRNSIPLTKKWIKQHIGTVHTFQGKEAQTVILLLGAPSPEQNGARLWAANNVNLLNVAVSRAKQNFYIVGNKALWSLLGHMPIITKFLEKDNISV